MSIKSELNNMGRFYRLPHECTCGSEELSENVVDHNNKKIYRACSKCKDVKHAKYLLENAMESQVFIKIDSNETKWVRGVVTTIDTIIDAEWSDVIQVYAEGEIYHVGKESIQNIRKIRSNDTVHFQDNYWESLKSYCSMAIENFFPLSKDVIFDIKEKEKVIEVRDDREHYITIKVGVKENKTIASFIEVPCWCVFGIEGEAYGKSQSVIETVRTLVDTVQNRQKDLYFLDLLESEFADTLGSEQEIPEDFIF